MSEHIDVQALHVFKLSVPLKKSYAVAYGRYDHAENVVVSISTGAGVVGWGCASPDSEVTGETVDSVIEAIRTKLSPALIDASESAPGRLLRIVHEAAPAAPAARAAIDIAIHDLWGKMLGHPLVAVFGGYRGMIPTSATIGICDVEHTLEHARELTGQGFRILKIKCGSDPESDIERVKSVRRESGERIAIRLDANMGYTREQARKVMDALAGEIEFIEQPVAAADVESLAALAAESKTPVMADESVLTAADALEVFRMGVPLVNVKLMKTGGIAEAARICDLALTLDRKVMIGCMDEMPISMAAAAHLALSHPAVEYADLDGHLDLDQHIATGGIIVNDGFVTVADAPGLGVDISKKFLRDSEISTAEK